MNVGIQGRKARIKKDGTWDMRYKESRKQASKEVRRPAKVIHRTSSSRRKSGGNHKLFWFGVLMALIVAFLYVAIKETRSVDVMEPVSEILSGSYVEEAVEEVIEDITPDYCKGEIEEIICSYDWDHKIAIAVAKAESGLRYDAFNVNTNGSHDIGVFQINSIHGQSPADMFDPVKNVEFAYQLWSAQGWAPWSAFNNGAWYKFHRDM